MSDNYNSKSIYSGVRVTHTTYSGGGIEQIEVCRIDGIIGRKIGRGGTGVYAEHPHRHDLPPRIPKKSKRGFGMERYAKGTWARALKDNKRKITGDIFREVVVGCAKDLEDCLIPRGHIYLQVTGRDIAIKGLDGNV